MDSPISISNELTEKFKAIGIGQPEIADNTGIDQSQVSRILSGKFKRRSKNVDKLCKYAKVEVILHKANPIHNQVLMNALSSVWDGTDNHAKAIAKILNAVGSIKN